MTLPDIWQVLKYAVPMGLTLCLIIGPIFFILIETRLSKGFWAAIAIDLGIFVSDILLISLAYYTSKSLLEQIEHFYLLYFVSGMVLVLFGLSSIFERTKVPKAKDKSVKVNYFSLFLKGVFLNVMNIGVFIFWAGNMITIHPTLGFKTEKTILYFAVVLAIFFSVDFLKIWLADFFKKFLTPQRIRKIRIYIGFVIVIIGMFVMMSPYHIKH